MFTRWYRENQKAIYELVILVILAVVTFVVLFRANFLTVIRPGCQSQ